MEVTNNQDTRNYVVVLTEKEGGTHEKFFDTGNQCHKYLSRHHDSVVAYKSYRITEDGERIFVSEGSFKPRTESEKQKNEQRKRRNRRRRQRANKRMREQQRIENNKNRSTRW